MTLYCFTCAACARPCEASQPTATTCSGACRQRLYAARRAARAVQAAADLLHRQTRAVIALTSTEDDAERERLRTVLANLAAEATSAFPAPTPNRKGTP